MAVGVWQVGRVVPGVRRGQQGVQAWEVAQRQQQQQKQQLVCCCWLSRPAAEEVNKVSSRVERPDVASQLHQDPV